MAIAEYSLEFFNRTRVVRVTEDRYQYDVVRDQEVGVARRKAIEIACGSAFATDHTGHRYCDDLKRAIVCVLHSSSSPEVVLKDLVVCVCGIVFDCADNRAWANETRDVIDVAVGVVSDDAFVQP